VVYLDGKARVETNQRKIEKKAMKTSRNRGYPFRLSSCIVGGAVRPSRAAHLKSWENEEYLIFCVQSVLNYLT
jgi:hypothetical protein